MNKVVDHNRKTILGYHDKESNEYTLVQEDPPILLDETYAPFLITRTHHYTVTTKEISTLINTYKRLSNFNKRKSFISQLLIFPGLIISLLFMLFSFDIVPEGIISTLLINNKAVNLTFWLSILGVIILWHDYYRNKSHPVRIPRTQKFDEKNFTEMMNSGIEFEKYSISKALYFLDEQSQELLVDFTSNEGVDSFELFKTLLRHEQIQTLLKRADLDLTEKNMGKHRMSKQNMPSYPLPAMRSIVVFALNEAILSGSDAIRPIHIFLSYMRVFPVLKRYLQNKNSSHGLLQEIAYYMVHEDQKVRSVNRLNVNFPYYATGGIAKSWVYGYTFTLNRFSKDLNQALLHEQDVFGIGHDREVDELVSVLGRLSKNNALLIGEPGVGKSSLIKGVAQRINWGNVPPQLRDKRIIQLDINALVALSQGKSNLEEMISKAMGELENAGNTILYIDEIQDIIPTTGSDSGQSLASILLPYIMEGSFPVVGSINYKDYKKYFYDNESLRNSFEPVEVAELSPRDTLRILQTKIDQLESNYKLYVTFPALTSSIELAQRYIADRRLPDSAVNTIEAACAWAQASDLKKIGSKEVARAMAMQTNIPVDEITAEEATNLMQLEDNIKARVIGQDEAVHSVVEALKRARTDIRDPNKPIGVFLFLGPTGTGKTHLSKTLAHEYFGRESEIIRLDMSEYQEISSISRIIGGDYDGSSLVTFLDKVKSKPHSVILFDEIEKAHPNILDLFLQLFDEGRLTSSHGETVNFTNCIIICTSNIGSKQILDSLESSRSMWEEAKQQALMELRGALRPELINRFDKIVIFAPHDINNLLTITKLILDELAVRVGEKGITLTWSENIPMLVADAANEPGMGARPIKRFIQDKIESQIANEMIAAQLGAGDTLEVKENWLR